MTEELIVDGRPDLYGPDRHLFGVTFAKRFPPYVFSTMGGASLVHKVARVRLRWYEVGPTMHTLRRMKVPQATAECVCGQYLYLNVASIRPHRRNRAKLCEVPAPGALLCGRCHGEVATFGPDGAGTKAGITRRIANQRLGCMVEGYGHGV